MHGIAYSSHLEVSELTLDKYKNWNGFDLFPFPLSKRQLPLFLNHQLLCQLQLLTSKVTNLTEISISTLSTPFKYFAVFGVALDRGRRTASIISHTGYFTGRYLYSSMAYMAGDQVA